MRFKSAAELEAERVAALREASAVARDAVLEEAALVADAKEAEMRKLGKAGEYPGEHRVVDRARDPQAQEEAVTQKRPLSERADTVLARAFERAIDDKEMLRAAAASLNRRLAREDLSATLVELVLYELRARALRER